MSPSLVRFLRCSLVWLSATALLMGAAWVLAHDLVLGLGDITTGTLADQSFETLLVWLCTFTAASCCVWLWLTSTVVILGVARGVAQDHRSRHERGCLGLVRRAVLIACGVAVVGSMAVPANAARSEVDRGPGAAGFSGRTLAGLPLPERAVRDAPLTRSPQAHVVPIVRTEKEPSLVRVEAGDTLWSIAARTLAPSASRSAISARWHAIYELNRTVIGADPDLILPGQQLRLNEV